LEAQPSQLLSHWRGRVDVEAETIVFQSLGEDPAQAIEVSREGVVVQIVSSDEVVMVATDVAV